MFVRNAPMRPRGMRLPGPSILAETALFGDSLTTQLLGYNLSPAFYINGIAAKGYQKIIANAGVSGNTTSQMLTRVNNNYVDGSATTGLAGLPPLGTVYNRNGTNDARASVSAASYETQTRSLVLAQKQYCQKVVCFTVPPIGPPEGSYEAKNALVIQYNEKLALIAADYDWLTLVDDNVNLRDGSGNQISAYFSDGIHTVGGGVYQQGITGAAALQDLYDSYNLVSPLSLDPLDLYPATEQYVSNHLMTGDITVTGTFPGHRANNWPIGNNGSPITGTLELIPADIGDTNQTTWQRVNINEVFQNGGGQSIRCTSGLLAVPITSSYPSRWDMALEMRFNNFDSTKFREFRLWVQGNTGTKISADMDLKVGGATMNERLVLRLAMPRIGLSAQASATLYFDLRIGSVYAGSMGSFDFRNVTVRGS